MYLPLCPAETTLMSKTKVVCEVLVTSKGMFSRSFSLGIVTFAYVSFLSMLVTFPTSRNTIVYRPSVRLRPRGGDAV
jgi:hypothetical protein